jgi:hypothetical protein
LGARPESERRSRRSARDGRASVPGLEPSRMDQFAGGGSTIIRFRRFSNHGQCVSGRAVLCFK